MRSPIRSALSSQGADPYGEDDGSDVAAETAADALAILREAGLSADGDAAGGPGDEDETDEEDLVGASGRPPPARAVVLADRIPPKGPVWARGWLGHAPHRFA